MPSALQCVYRDPDTVTISTSNGGGRVTHCIARVNPNHFADHFAKCLANTIPN
jgi:hypothetical protein